MALVSVAQLDRAFPCGGKDWRFEPSRRHKMLLTLNSKIETLAKVGPIFSKRLCGLGIETIKDLLWYFPQRYEDFSQITPIKQAKLNEKACFCGTISQFTTKKTFKRGLFLTEALLQDKTACLRVVWFNQPYLAQTLKEKDLVCLAGKVAMDKGGIFLQSPSYEKVFEEENLTHTGRIIPIYPETKGISSRYLRYLVKQALKAALPSIQETLPENILKQQALLPLSKALTEIHFPSSFATLEMAKERFGFEEIFLIQLAVLKQKLKVQKQKAPSVPFKVELVKDLVAKLPFKLTDAQRKCSFQILKDLERKRPMSRLLEGDVGSGKTVVAVIAMLSCCKAGFQAALMAPTEILAQQHFNEVSKLLQPFKIKIALLTGKKDKIISQKIGYQTREGFKPETMEISRIKLLEKTKLGEINVLIGTHSLIQEKVKFNTSEKNGLALVVIDEQHRFGIKQRQKLVTGKSNKLLPHFLSMTATPIPRTLALTLYGNLDLSLLDEMPKGRKRITTEIVAPKERQRVYAFIKKEIKQGNQVFVICPRIELPEENEGNLSAKKSSWAEVKAVEEEYDKLSKVFFKSFKVEMLHGKMKPKEKEKIMLDFKRGKFDILVSTSVVEVGVDIPGATAMLIESAERFGLAQLHQFRGRIGRNKKEAFCFLFTESNSQKTKQRLKAILKAKNGFELAEYDLQIRGPGGLTSVKQWGLPDLAMLALKNLKLVEKTREQAKETLTNSPNLVQYPILREAVARFEKIAHLE